MAAPFRLKETSVVLLGEDRDGVAAETGDNDVVAINAINAVICVVQQD